MPAAAGETTNPHTNHQSCRSVASVHAGRVTLQPEAKKRYFSLIHVFHSQDFLSRQYAMLNDSGKNQKGDTEAPRHGSAYGESQHPAISPLTSHSQSQSRSRPQSQRPTYPRQHKPNARVGQDLRSRPAYCPLSAPERKVTAMEPALREAYLAAMPPATARPRSSRGPPRHAKQSSSRMGSSSEHEHHRRHTHEYKIRTHFNHYEFDAPYILEAPPCTMLADTLSHHSRANHSMNVRVYLHIVPSHACMLSLLNLLFTWLSCTPIFSVEEEFNLFENLEVSVVLIVLSV